MRSIGPAVTREQSPVFLRNSNGLFRQGKELANAKAWKEGGIAANLAAFIGAAVVVAGGFGYDLNISDAVVNQAAAGIAALFCLGNAIVHVITSSKVGLPSPPDAAPESDRND